jgi:hypothetical protein
MKEKNITDISDPNLEHTGQTVLIKSIVYVSVFMVCSFLFWSQIYKGYGGDMPYHVDQAKAFEYENILQYSHPGFNILVSGFSKVLHLNPESVAVVLIAFSVVLIVLIIDMVLNSMLKGLYSSGFFMFVTITLILVSAIYVPFFNKHVYLGQGSPNVWHNPTLILSKPFAYVVFHFSVLLFCYKRKRIQLTYCILVSFTLFVCTIIKPSFAFAFLLAVVVFVLLFHYKSPQAYLAVLILAFPVILLLGVQYLIAYGSQHESGIEIAFLKAIRMYSPCVPISILLAISFPLCILLFRLRQILKDNHLILAWLVLLIALIQKALFIETGSRMDDGNFSWGYQISLQIVFVYSMVELLRWLKIFDGRNLWEKIKVIIASVVFSLHLISGVWYFGKILAGKSYL